MSRAGFYSPEETMWWIFTGGPEEAISCHRQLASLGEDLEGDRLRGLVVELVLFARRQRHPDRGSLLADDGRPMTDREIASAIGWDPARIGRDLRRIMAAGLIERVTMSDRDGMEGYPE